MEWVLLGLLCLKHIVLAEVNKDGDPYSKNTTISDSTNQIDQNHDYDYENIILAQEEWTKTPNGHPVHRAGPGVVIVLVVFILIIFVALTAVVCYMTKTYEKVPLIRDINFSALVSCLNPLQSVEYGVVQNNRIYDLPPQPQPRPDPGMVRPEIKHTQQPLPALPVQQNGLGNFIKAGSSHKGIVSGQLARKTPSKEIMPVSSKITPAIENEMKRRKELVGGVASTQQFWRNQIEDLMASRLRSSQHQKNSPDGEYTATIREARAVLADEEYYSGSASKGTKELEDVYARLLNATNRADQNDYRRSDYPRKHRTGPNMNQLYPDMSKQNRRRKTSPVPSPAYR